MISPDSPITPAASCNREWPGPWLVLAGSARRSHSNRAPARKPRPRNASRSPPGRGHSDSRRRATKPRPALPLPHEGSSLDVRATRFVSSLKRRPRQPLHAAIRSPRRALKVLLRGILSRMPGVAKCAGDAFYKSMEFSERESPLIDSEAITDEATSPT